MNRDNQPTFNVNRKIANFSDFASNKETLKKAELQTKPNSEDQQHIGNDRNEFDPNTHKVTQVTPDEVKDKLDAIEELEGVEKKSTIKKFNESVFSDDGHAGMNGERYEDEKNLTIKQVKKLIKFCLSNDSVKLTASGDLSARAEDIIDDEIEKIK